MVLAYLLKENLKRTVEFTQVLLDAFDVARPVVTDYGREVLDEYDRVGVKINKNLSRINKSYCSAPMEKVGKYHLADLERSIIRGEDSEFIKDKFFEHERIRDILVSYSDLELFSDKEFCEAFGESYSEELDKKYSKLRNEFYSSLK